MKTSIDLPDDLYARVKAKSAMERRTVREVATTLLAGWVDSGTSEPSKVTDINDVNPTGSSWLHQWGELGNRIAVSRPDVHRQADGAVEGLVEQLRTDRR